MAIKPAAFGLTDVGRKRDQNEDYFLADESLGLYVVCDGMGGHAAGEVASSSAANFVLEHVAAHRDVLARLAADPSQDNRFQAQLMLQKAVQSACAGVYRLSRGDVKKRGMGTTLDCIVTAGAGAVLAHVGDSRVYLVRRGRAHRLTEDHTLVAAQIKAGVITREQADASDWKNVLTHSVGIQPSVQVDTLYFECHPGDVLLLCSDGLHQYLADEEVADVLTSAPLAALPRKLVDLANERGGADNVTALVVGFGARASKSDEADAAAMMEALQRIPLFAHLTYKEQAAVLALSSGARYPGGHHVVREGARGEDLFIVVSGRVAVEKDGIQISELGPGGHFGEMGLVGNAPRSATVRTLEASHVMTIRRDHLMALMRKEPRLAVKLLWNFAHELSDRLRAANNEIVDARHELAGSRGDEPYITVDTD